MGFPNLLQLKLNYFKEKHCCPILFFKYIEEKKQDLLIKHKINKILEMFI